MLYGNLKIRNYIVHISISTALFLFVTSCASFYNPTVDNPSPYAKPNIIDKNFDISGRFSIKTKEKNEYGNFTWIRVTDNESMELRSPIGNTVAKITVESKVATLETKDQTYKGDDLDQMMENNLGFTLPMQSLHYWIQGVALPDTPVDAQLKDGFVQLGWKVEYLAWQDSNHPKILQCSKGDLVIKLLLEW